MVLYDKLGNSKISVLDRLETIAGKKLTFIEGDARDTAKLKETLKTYHIGRFDNHCGRAPGYELKNEKR